MRVENYNIEVLKWAEEKFRVENIGEKFPKLKDWVRGLSGPTIKQLAKFSKATSIPFGYFFLDKLPALTTGVPLFRTDSQTPTEDYSAELTDTISVIQKRQEWLKEFAISEGYEMLEFVGSFDERSNVIQVADDIRSKLKLNIDWAERFRNWEESLKHLFDKTEQAQIYISINGVVENNTHRVLNPSEFRGFVLTDNYVPYIFINGQDFTAAKMFTIAHELAHIWLGKTAAFDLKNLMPSRQAIEMRCNEIAAEFLVPQDSLTDFWKQIKSDKDQIEKIAKHYKVSQIVAARRLLDIGKLEKVEFLNFYEKYRENWTTSKKKKQKGGDFYNNQNYRVGKSFFTQVLTAAKEGKLLYTDAYKLTGLYGKSFSKFEEALSKS
ncbi:MAG: hypothetical protein HGGPFJEG_00313 [Ignavibacteria bacterium]|nr:hypothetical protein [Ignavibacteria bacterium]